MALLILESSPEEAANTQIPVKGSMAGQEDPHKAHFQVGTPVPDNPQSQ